MRIDSHQHFWIYSATQYPWIKPEWPIRRDFLPPDLAPELNKHNLDGCIAVQARQTLQETRWLLQLTEKYPLIQGVVGWVDLRAPNVVEQLKEFALHPKFVGVRHVVQDEPDDNFMLQPDFLRGIAGLEPFNLVYDLLIFPKQLRAAIEIVRRFPRQKFVLDHIAKPNVKDKTFEPWAPLISELAQSPNVSCKISGMVTEADWREWKPADFAPYFSHIHRIFGEDRLMYGSDWPVCLLAASYGQVFSIADELATKLTPEGRQKFFGANTTRIYSIVR